MQPLIVAMWLFLLPCSYSCHNVAILATMQLLIVAMWLFLLPSSYSCHNVAILAAIQLFLPPCGYSCCPAAVIPAICGFTFFYSFRLHHLVVLVSRPFLLPCSYITYPRVAKLPCECSPSPASYHERGHFIALSLQPLLSLASLVEDSRCSYL